MKKSLLFAAAVAMFFSCSQDDNVSPVIMDDVSNLVPIQLNVGSAVQQTTRGKGAVGDVEGSANVWGGQSVFVYMFKHNTLDLAEFRGSPIYQNKEFVVAGTIVDGTANTIEAQTKNGSIDYYPPTGSYDFWGYRLDDAQKSDPAPEGNKLVADFEINGSQDIMIARAENTITEDDDPDYADVNSRKYSAYSARHGLQPELQFQHLLTRLKFFAIAGVQDAAVGDDAVSIESISVTSKTTGKLVVAYTGNDISRITDMDNPKELSLMERSDDDTNKNLQELTRTPLQWDAENNTGVKLQIGESLIVYPETSYKARVVLHQNIKVNNNSPSREDVLYSYDFELNTTGGFLAGHSYNIYLTFYGLQNIKTAMSLAPWDDVDDDQLKFDEENDLAD